MARDAPRPSISELIEQITTSADDSSFAFPSDSSREAARTLADELLALDSIYADDRLSVVSIDPAGSSSSSSQWTSNCKLRLELQLPLDSPSPSPSSLRLSISLPPSYPASTSPPQLQLLDRFLGPYEVDTKLFSEVLRIFRSSHDEPWGEEGDASRAVLFEGCEEVKGKVEAWLKEMGKRDKERRANDERGAAGDEAQRRRQDNSEEAARASSSSSSIQPSQPAPVPPEALSARSKRWTTTDAVVERKSTFVGHAVPLHSPLEVPYLLESLMEKYPRMDKATHPLMRAWVCTEQREGKKVTHRDNDDDGESAAGGRLAHLLDTLRCENVLVVVTRWYGGIHLGADRFKVRHSEKVHCHLAPHAPLSTFPSRSSSIA
ncbi:ribosomal protein S5 domain 2-like protein [Jaminaea rosea]|uniref:Ribosomal protein S5 domain 2-like protein n=1 Tax=Jaminaea rosea TaxID=1569628 RepID=A0A316UKS6_9BASI|nr:ribosomal protein S5 domain 2-like protein [Jaminaea rosea]PWN25857.1 ribosomal protein S5 domain 2-like protein [Jaminaea rosea]